MPQPSPGSSNPGERAWEKTDSKTTALLVLGLLVLTAVAYANSIPHPFVYDDISLVRDNEEIRSLANIPEMIGFGEEGFTLRTRWTRNITHALEYQAVGAWAPLYHATNVALHAIVGLLIFMLVTQMARDRVLGWWAAALFVVHPITTDVVAQVSGRRGLLTAVFALTALILLLGYTRRGGIWRLAAAMIAVYLATFSKALGVMTPLAFLFVDLFSRMHGNNESTDEADRPSVFTEIKKIYLERKLVYGIGTFLMIVMAVAIIAFNKGLDGHPSYYDATEGGLGLWNRLRLIGMGLRLLLVPVGLTVDYSYDALGIINGWSSLATVDMLVLAAAVGLTVFGVLRRSWATFAGAWFFIFYAPHMGLIRWHEIFAERFLYLPSIGIFVGLAAVGVRLARRWPTPALTAGVAVLALLTTGTIVQNRVWASEKALWTNASERYPNCARAQKAMGDVYMAETRPDMAAESYRTAIGILPHDLGAHIGLARAETLRMDYAAALQTLDGILEFLPDEAEAWSLKGHILQTVGEVDGAIEAYSRSIEHAPELADGYNRLGQLYAQLGELDKAVELCETALTYDPTLVSALQSLAIVYRKGYGDEDRAVEYEARIQELAPPVN